MGKDTDPDQIGGDLYGYMKVIKFFLGLFCCDCFLGDLYVFMHSVSSIGRIPLTGYPQLGDAAHN
jgi:hypothetical protein